MFLEWWLHELIILRPRVPFMSFSVRLFSRSWSLKTRSCWWEVLRKRAVLTRLMFILDSHQVFFSSVITTSSVMTSSSVISHSFMVMLIWVITLSQLLLATLSLLVLLFTNVFKLPD